MIQHADILTAVKTRWDRDKTLDRLIPGELHYRENTGTAEPWATFWLDDDDPEYNSGATYVQDVTLDVGVFSTRGPVNAGALADAIDRLFDWRHTEWFVLPKQAHLLAIRPTAGTLELDEGSREARAVLLLSRRYRLTIQAER